MAKPFHVQRCRSYVGLSQVPWWVVQLWLWASSGHIIFYWPPCTFLMRSDVMIVHSFPKGRLWCFPGSRSGVPKGKACLGLLLIMMEPMEQTCVPLLSFNGNFLYLILICHILCRQIGKLNCSCVSLAVFYSCTLCHFSVYLKLTALNSVEFLNAHPSQTPTLFYTYIILHSKFLSFGALKVGFSKSGS